MADQHGDELPVIQANPASDAAAFDEGYRQVMREIAWARARGWYPTQRQLTVALMHAMRVYGTVRGGKTIGGQRPEWLRGQAEALRELLRDRIGDRMDVRPDPD